MGKKREAPLHERKRKEKEHIKRHDPKLNRNRGGGGRKPEDGR